MPRRSFLIAALATLPIAFAATPGQADTARYLEEARKLASSMPPKLVEVLEDEIAKGGAAQAIAVCREKAPKMAAAASEQSGWNIRRVSLRNRNPKAAPDAWEKAALEEFDRRAAAGESAATLEKGEVVSDGGQQVYRYMKALPTRELCLQCHGTPEKLDAAAKARLGELYPEDKATGYTAGQLRGAMTLKKAL